MKKYKSFHLLLTFVGLGTVLSHGQEAPPPSEGNDPPKFENFHSNLGQQGIVELAGPDERSGKKGWGSKKRRWGDRFSPLGNAERKPCCHSGFPFGGSMGWPPQEKAEPEAAPSAVQVSGFAGTRPYHTSNVLRTKSNEVSSGVWENSLGASMTTEPVKAGSYFTMIPRLDLIMQWSNYGEETVSDLLDYRFGMIKGGLGIPLAW